MTSTPHTPSAALWILAGALPAAALCARVALTASSLPAAPLTWLHTASLAWLSAAAHTMLTGPDR
ncbi:hypothetical protein [Streptomyces sp. NPDC048256]|uniref:hypothetical protein n=1 Tax=unclassified Streptomyces TaxID=2593676 RepID=UPI0033F70CCA